MEILRALGVLVLCIGLAACGGGESGSSNPGDGEPPVIDVQALARDAKVVSRYSFSDNFTTLQWRDTFPPGRQYQVNYILDNGLPYSAPVVNAVNGKLELRLEARRADGTPRTFQVQGRLSPTDAWVPLLTAMGNTTITTSPPPRPAPTIEVSPDEQMHNRPVAFTLAGLDPVYRTIEWRTMAARGTDDPAAVGPTLHFAGDREIDVRADVFVDADHAFMLHRVLLHNPNVIDARLVARREGANIVLDWTLDMPTTVTGFNEVSFELGAERGPVLTDAITWSDHGTTRTWIGRSIVSASEFPGGDVQAGAYFASLNTGEYFWMRRIVNADNPSNIVVH